VQVAHGASGPSAPAPGAGRGRLSAQAGQLLLEIGRQRRGVFEARIPHGDVRQLARQIDQRERQQMRNAQSFCALGGGFGRISYGDTRDCNDRRVISCCRADGASVEIPLSQSPRPGVACSGMQEQGDSAARLAVLDELRRSALDTYGEERSADAHLQTALGVAATAVWRVSEEPLEPLGNDPLPTHG
jgi:hypothetical protein